MKYRKTTKIKYVLFSFLSLLFLSFKGFNKLTFLSGLNHYEINFIPAKTSNELIELRTNKKANLIRTLDDFDRILKLDNSIFSKLSSDQITDLKKNIVTRTDIGVVGLKYSILSDNLSYNDFAEAMSMFGLDIKNGYWGLSNNESIQSQVYSFSEILSPEHIRGVSILQSSEDYTGYACDAPHDCVKMKNYICMTGC